MKTNMFDYVRLKAIRLLVALTLIVFAITLGLIGSLTPVVSANLMIGDAPTKSYDDFIDAVWAFESDIDPSQQDYYNKNWNNPVASYPEIDYPGRVVRDSDGNPVPRDAISIEVLFYAIGIGDLYDPNDLNPDWKLIQSNVINYLGFVGFQFQESDLVDIGYYTFPEITVDDKLYPMHYVDLPNKTWANGVRSTLVFPPVVNEPTLASDTVAFFDSNFTGKKGISSYADFTNPDKHILVIKDHFTNKYNGIVTELKAKGKTIEDYLGTFVYWNELDPPISPPPGGRANKVEITMSGLLAGAHLRGAAGVVELLVDHKNPSDENRTYILQYVQDYAGYDTPFGGCLCARGCSGLLQQPGHRVDAVPTEVELEGCPADRAVIPVLDSKH